MFQEVKINTEYITLGQFLKYVGIIDSGFLAKIYLSENYAIVNGEKENRRGRKLYPGYEIIAEGKKYLIESWVISQ